MHAEPVRTLTATFVVNDDIEAALMLGADGVHSAAGTKGAARARDQGLLLGLSASSLRKRVQLSRSRLHRRRPASGETPSKNDADPAIGLEGLREICDMTTIPS